jgi:hypothetical protein
VGFNVRILATARCLYGSAKLAISNLIPKPFQESGDDLKSDGGLHVCGLIEVELRVAGYMFPPIVVRLVSPEVLPEPSVGVSGLETVPRIVSRGFVTE